MEDPAKNFTYFEQEYEPSNRYKMSATMTLGKSAVIPNILYLKMGIFFFSGA